MLYNPSKSSLINLKIVLREVSGSLLSLKISLVSRVGSKLVSIANDRRGVLSIY